MPTNFNVKSPNPDDFKPHPAFKAVLRNQSGLYVWRVVKLDLEKVPEDQVGTFFTGDCYLILSVIKPSDMRIHYWIGAESSIDEKATAAIMAVALDDYFGGAPVQTREAQGIESAGFLRYFEKNKGIRYLEGGVESGLRHVGKKQHRDALYHIKGTAKASRVTQVPLTWASFNAGDTFVVDLGTVIFVWKGKESRNAESFAGASFAQQLRNERGGKNCAVVITEDGCESSDLKDGGLEMWNKHLPLSKKNVKPASEGGNDETAVREHSARLKLYRCREENGNTSIREEKMGPLNREDLQSDDSFNGRYFRNSCYPKISLRINISFIYKISFK